MFKVGDRVIFNEPLARGVGPVFGDKGVVVAVHGNEDMTIEFYRNVGNSTKRPPAKLGHGWRTTTLGYMLCDEVGRQMDLFEGV